MLVLRTSEQENQHVHKMRMLHTSKGSVAGGTMSGRKVARENKREMKLAAIYNVWTDTQDLFPLSIQSIKPYVDVVILVASIKSNYGQHGFYMPWNHEGVDVIMHEPIFGLSPYQNERTKRQVGIDRAKELDCTHFILMDGDEFYEANDVIAAIHFMENILCNGQVNGLVVNCTTYFKSPRLYVRDTTLVPFIHKLYMDTKCGLNPKYPYAWVAGKIRIDPTRQLNYTNGIVHATHKGMPIQMHHYSWVRGSFTDKIENSTARDNIKRSTIIRDLSEAKEGYFCEFYGQTLQRATVDFNVPELANEAEIHKLMAGSYSDQP
jgi:hypothetical protein